MTEKPVIDKFLHAIETADDSRLRRVERGRDARRDRAQLAAARGRRRTRSAPSTRGGSPTRAASTSCAATPSSGGSAEVVEYTLSWTENGVPHAGPPPARAHGARRPYRRRHGLLRRPLAGRAARRDGGGRCRIRAVARGPDWPNCSRGATERTVLDEAPGKSGATLERVVIDGQPYVLKHLDLADDWTMRASGCLRGAPLDAVGTGHPGPAARLPQPADRGGASAGRPSRPAAAPC